MKSSINIANRIAQRITGRYNQNVTMIMVGDTGSGKSYAALRLACDVSTLVAKIKGGKREDYFSVDKNMSVIDITKFFDVLDKAQKWNTVILDDAGVSINARKFMDEINITVNNIIQTYRTLNLFTIFTVPQMFLIDKVSRALVNFYCELEGVVAPNLSRGKLFELQKKSRLGSAGKLFYVYPRGSAEKSISILFKKPPEDICRVYDKLREQGALEYKTKSIKALEDGGEGNKKQEISTAIETEKRLRQGDDPIEIADELGIAIKTVLGSLSSLKRAGAI